MGDVRTAYEDTYLVKGARCPSKESPVVSDGGNTGSYGYSSCISGFVERYGSSGGCPVAVAADYYTVVSLGKSHVYGLVDLLVLVGYNGGMDDGPPAYRLLPYVPRMALSRVGALIDI